MCGVGAVSGDAKDASITEPGAGTAPPPALKALGGCVGAGRGHYAEAAPAGRRVGGDFHSTASHAF